MRLYSVIEHIFDALIKKTADNGKMITVARRMLY